MVNVESVTQADPSLFPITAALTSAGDQHGVRKIRELAGIGRTGSPSVSQVVAEADPTPSGGTTSRLFSRRCSRDYIPTYLAHVSPARRWVYSRRQSATGVASTVGVAGCPPAAMTKALTKAASPSGLNAAAVKSRELLTSPQASV